jgi:translation initiation factor IF-3
MVGVIPTSDALRLSLEAGLDLVEVSPNERPPVCRIMDFGKFKYEQKKKHAANTKTHQTVLKEVRLRPKTGTHDIEFKIKQARSFLEHKDKVKVNVVFRGRENAHHDRGRDVINQFVAGLEDIAKVEQPCKMDGAKQMSVVLAPKA